MNKKETTLVVGQEQNLKAITSPKGVSVTWESENPDIVSVSTTGRIKGEKVGQTTIKATAGSKVATCLVTVEQITVSLSAKTVIIDVSEKLTYQLEATNSKNLSGSYVWTSSNEGVATVDEDGLVTAVSKGQTTITASKGDAFDTCEVTVTAPEDYYVLSCSQNKKAYEQAGKWFYYSGKEMGSRTITWNTNIENGIQEIETIGALENDDGKYSMKEVSKGIGNELKFHKKELNRDNKSTGEKEQFVYQKDDNGNEIYFKISNGKTSFRITKSSRGITIDNYENGQLIESFEYDKDGKAIEGMGMSDIDQLDENYIENFFDSQVPYFEAENKEISVHDIEQSTDGQALLNSAIEATEESTRTSIINTQAENIKQLAKEKDEKSKGMEIE